MPTPLRIAIAQINLTVGDLKGNLQKHLAAAFKARDELKADLIVFPELGLAGYQPEDLLLRQSFLEDCDAILHELIENVKDIHFIVGHPLRTSDGIMNACSCIYNGKTLGQYAKQHLPNYGVFDEYRYFVPGNATCIVNIKEVPVALLICEDLWSVEPAQNACANGAQLIIAPNASPFEINKADRRLKILRQRAIENHINIVYANLVGGQDEIVFDGGSIAVNSKGELTHFSGYFTENVQLINDFNHPIATETNIHHEEMVYKALMLGLKDYIHKNHFKSVFVGVSGGIDSALTLTIAVDALGKENVKAIYMPSRYSADLSHQEAKLITEALGVSFECIPIEPVYKSFLTSLSSYLESDKPDITEQNIQARCRAVILMAVSNKTGALVLTTGNRSEIAVGYCTLYGDMAGGFGVLKDVPKTMVYALAKYRNTISPVIPNATIERAPTAELAPNQRDEDSLPPYPVLDQVLELYLNEGLSLPDIIAQGYEENMVKHVIKLIKTNEYKRKQSALGPRINHKSFGKDWRYPNTNGYKK